ncbi:MAG TPA: hypothetical protein VIR27_09180 [Mycobacteriales bacterium]
MAEPSDELSPLERRLVAAVAEDSPLVVSDVVPTGTPDPANTVRARVLRDILLGRLVEHPGPHGVRLHGGYVSGELDLVNVRDTSPLHLSCCRFAQPVLLLDAHLPSLAITDCHLRGLDADRVRVDSALLLAGSVIDGVGSDCAVRLSGAQVGGQLSLTGARLTAGGNCALQADGLSVGGDLLLRHGFQARAGGDRDAVRLLGARIGGNLDCDGSVITATGGAAVNLERVEVSGNLYLRGARANGHAPAGVVLVGARVTGQVSATGAEFTSTGGPAMLGDGAQTGGDVYVNGGFGAHGGVRLVGARIGGHLDCTDGHARVDDPNTLALDLRFATVGGMLRLSRSFAGPGVAEVRSGLVALDGLTYAAPPVGMDRAEWTVVLAEQTPSYAAQPYQQLAGAYRAAGREDDARRVLIAQQRDLLRRGDLHRLARLRHRVLDVLLGFGYQSWRSLLALVVTLALAVVFILGLAAGGHAVATPAKPGQPAVRCSTVDQVALGVDLALPLIDTGAKDHCELAPTRPVEETYVAVGWLFQLLGWSFATLFVAGFTGLVRRA